MEIEFYGAAGEVTGSCHILRFGTRQVLIDCGLIQGGRDADRRNREPFPFEPREIDAVLLTHAHLDHSGRLPLLVKRGFRGPIYTTNASCDLLAILLRDAAHLASRESERINRRREPGAPLAHPLFDLQDVNDTLEQVRPIRYDTSYAPLPGLSLRVRDAGHIMGSASLELLCREGSLERTVVFSGDLGPYDSPILLDPHAFKSADLVVMESTYGDRRHRSREATLAEFDGIIQAAAQSGGNIIIPAFAIGRSQELLYVLGQYFDRWQLSSWQIFLDSPMAIEASSVYWKHVDRHDEEARHFRESFGAMPALPNLSLCRTPDESMRINSHRSNALIIAGSGMCNGGRVLHHLQRNLDRPECHVMIVGFQAPGTLGRSLVDGAKAVRIFGETIEVKATIHTVGGFSAHGDQADLLKWYDCFDNHPTVCLVHGDREPAKVLQQRIHALGAKAVIPAIGTRMDLGAIS